APNGIMYVTPTVRKSLLAKMLTELLDTRVLVKQSMKTSKDDKGSGGEKMTQWIQALLRVLDARQLSLKFICNVTYGYTSASFSGRMPTIEIADSIVQRGRETLEKVINRRLYVHYERTRALIRILRYYNDQHESEVGR
ncbi:DNA polymerase zeta, partial [Tulasnella sp. 427]